MISGVTLISRALRLLPLFSLVLQITCPQSCNLIGSWSHEGGAERSHWPTVRLITVSTYNSNPLSGLYIHVKLLLSEVKCLRSNVTTHVGYRSNPRGHHVMTSSRPHTAIVNAVPTWDLKPSDWFARKQTRTLIGRIFALFTLLLAAELRSARSSTRLSLAKSLLLSAIPSQILIFKKPFSPPCRHATTRQLCHLQIRTHRSGQKFPLRQR